MFLVRNSVLDRSHLAAKLVVFYNVHRVPHEFSDSNFITDQLFNISNSETMYMFWGCIL